MRWQAVLFDLDDTLYLERDYVISGFRAVAGWLGGRIGRDQNELYQRLVGWFEQGVRGNTFNLLLEGLSLESEGLVEQMVRVYREHQPRIAPSPEVPAMLADLAEECALGLVSDGSSTTQRLKLETLGMQEYFRVVIISDELPGKVRKPSPLPFRAALEGLGVAPERAVYVADNPNKDFLGARRAGVASLRVRRPQGLYGHLEPADQMHAPDMEVADLADLAGRLAALAAKG